MEEELGRIFVTRGTQTKERIWRTKTVAVDAPTGQSFWRPELEAGGLLPGLPNDITLDGIVSKLPWSAFAVLSLVSRLWREAIENRQVFNARVRSNSTETLVLIRSDDGQKISLYSIRDKRWYQLPRIPHLRSSKYSGITSVDGKIYVLGGWSVDHDMVEAEWSAVARRVYVFDPAGQRKWRRCADMLERKDVRCGVVEGKIYVFSGMYGGYDDIDGYHACGPYYGYDGYACRPEVYDPKLNTWSQIASIPSPPLGLHNVLRLGLFDVLTLGEELFLLNRFQADDIPALVAYHTVKDEWRVVERFPQHDYSRVFIAQGKFHLMTSIGIDVLNDEKNAWQHLHSHAKQSSAADADEADEVDFTEVIDVIAVNDELYSATCSSSVGSFSGRNISSLLRSRGFRSDRGELLWQQEAAFQEGFTFECTVQL